MWLLANCHSELYYSMNRQIVKLLPHRQFDIRAQIIIIIENENVQNIIGWTYSGIVDETTMKTNIGFEISRIIWG